MKTFEEFILEKKETKEKFGIPYADIVIPPDDLEKCAKLYKYYCKGGNLSDKEVDKQINEMKNGNKKDKLGLQHETIHSIQDKKYHYLFKGSNIISKIDVGKSKQKLDKDELEGEDLEIYKKYMSVPSEIMAYAFFIAKDYPKKEKDLILKLYKMIGGNVEKLFNFYVDEYKKHYDK